MSGPTPLSVLEQISTCWPMIHNPTQFVMRYARAIQRYVSAMMRNADDADEVSQEFLVRVFDKGFCPENVSRGRFRDYLKAAVRYVAISHLRKKRPSSATDEQLASLADATHSAAEADRTWNEQWRLCLLERVWQALELSEKQAGHCHHTVLRQFSDDPGSDSPTHADRLAQHLGRPVRADAFRQLLRRARRQFAQLVIEEVRRTLHSPSQADIEQELADLELLDLVRNHLDRPDTNAAEGDH